jgi:hypothetical protein
VEEKISSSVKGMSNRRAARAAMRSYIFQRAMQPRCILDNGRLAHALEGGKRSGERILDETFALRSDAVVE